MKSSRRRLNIALIGAGSVGTTLAVMLRSAGHRTIAVVSRDRRSAQRCGRMVSCKNCTDRIEAIPAAVDFILIAVPDRAIRSIAESLAQLSHLDFVRLHICHTSGALTSDELAPLAARGSSVFSFHPVQSFPKSKPVRLQVRSMKGISYGIEGPASSLRVARRLAKQLGGVPLIIPKDAKILYHCACVIASNYAVTLVGAVEALAKEFSGGGVGPFIPLLETSIANAVNTGAAKALTGPLIRGDLDVVAEHLKSLSDADLLRVYRSLGVYASRLAERSGTIGPDDANKIVQLLLDSA